MVFTGVRSRHDASPHGRTTRRRYCMGTARHRRCRRLRRNKDCHENGNDRWRRPERGACAQCHGERGRGGVSADVPALSVIGKQLTVVQLKQIINHGLGESANPKKPYMPVWGQVISAHQVADLVAYIRAGLPSVPGATAPPVITGQGPAVEGALLYQRYGCVNCHGPNALGGVPNPQSPDKAIPALSGADFFKEFDTDQKIIAVIRSGSVLGQAPIVSMPHWGGIIPDEQLRALVAYIKTLKTG